MQMSNDDLRTERFKDRFVRWQKTTIDQLSFLNYLLIFMSGGILVYEINLIFPSSQFDINQIIMILISSLFLSFSVLLGICTAINRLRDFRKTKKLVRTRWTNENKEDIKNLETETDNLGNWTWGFFWVQTILFICGIVVLAMFIGLHILKCLTPQ